MNSFPNPLTESFLDLVPLVCFSFDDGGIRDAGFVQVRMERENWRFVKSNCVSDGNEWMFCSKYRG